MDIELLPTQNTEGERKEIQHPWHADHPLTFEDFELSGLDRVCAACHYGVVGRVFGCQDCNFYLHHDCAELPVEVHHPSHPTHPLKLRALTIGGKLPRCGLCNREFVDLYGMPELVYACDNPNNICFEVGAFFMHIGCALLKWPLTKHPIHEHPLVLTAEYDCPANCAACGTEIQSSSRGNKSLGALLVRTHHYRCSECNVRIHQGCVEVDAPTTSEAQAPRLWSSISFINSLIPSAALLEITVNEGDDIKCYLCRSLVNGPAYGHEKCRIFLHQHCAKVPEYLLHPMHEFPLYCSLKLERDEFVCNLCHLTHEGDDFPYFIYKSTHTNFKMHSYCAALKATWHHPSHEHPFVFVKEGRPSNSVNCSACGTEICSTSYYLCWTCNISFHVRCFDSPSIIELDRHQHPLTLNFDPLPIDYDHNIDYFCDACNEERDVHTYSYVCWECDYICHIRCDLFDIPQDIRYEREDKECQRIIAEQEAALDEIQKHIELLKQELCTLESKKSACEEYIKENRIKREEIRKMSKRY